jgi:hypothetical protein
MSDFALTPEMIEAAHDYFYENSRPHLVEFYGVFDVGELIKALAPTMARNSSGQLTEMSQPDS